MWTLDDFSESIPPNANLWNDDGVVILEDFIPDGLIDAYLTEWHRENGYRCIRDDGTLDADRPGGYPTDTPYLDHPALRDLVTYGPLGAELERLIGEPAGVHLNLSGLVSTQRSYHADSYLNEAEVGDRYAAIWLAVGPEPVHPDSGPFQYVRGSHAWGTVTTKEKMGQVVDLLDPSWPKHSEDFLYSLYLDEIARRGAEVVSFTPSRGTVLIWHPYLIHQGSMARVPGLYRGGLIAHYSGQRSGMGILRQAPGGGYYFPFGA